MRLVFASVALLTALTGLTMFLAPKLAGESLWPFRIAPIGARYWGVLFLSIALGAGLATRARAWGQVRPLFAPGLAYTGLSLAAGALHFDSFDPARWVTWSYFALYAVVFSAGLLVYVGYETGARRP